MSIEVSHWNPFDHFTTKEEISAYLQSCCEDKDSGFLFADAISNLVKKHGIEESAKLSGLSKAELKRN